MAGVEKKNDKLDYDDEDDEEFLRNDKVISIIYLLNKYKIKLWEVPNLESFDGCMKIESLMCSFEVTIRTFRHFF